MDKRHGVIGIGLGHRLYIKNGLGHSDDAYCLWTAILKLFGGIFASHLMFAWCSAAATNLAGVC